MPRVAVAIVTKNRLVLMVRRRDSFGSIQWTFPGGTIEEGESEEEAVLREVAEETGINCSLVRVLGKRVHPATNRLISYYACEYRSGKVSLTEPEKFSEVQWFSPREVLTLTSGRVFEPVREYLRSL